MKYYGSAFIVSEVNSAFRFFGKSERDWVGWLIYFSIIVCLAAGFIITLLNGGFDLLQNVSGQKTASTTTPVAPTPPPIISVTNNAGPVIVQTGASSTATQTYNQVRPQPTVMIATTTPAYLGSDGKYHAVFIVDIFVPNGHSSNVQVSTGCNAELLTELSFIDRKLQYTVTCITEKPLDSPIKLFEFHTG